MGAGCLRSWIRVGTGEGGGAGRRGAARRCPPVSRKRAGGGGRGEGGIGWREKRGRGGGGTRRGTQRRSGRPRRRREGKQKKCKKNAKKCKQKCKNMQKNAKNLGFFAFSGSRSIRGPPASILHFFLHFFCFPSRLLRGLPLCLCVPLRVLPSSTPPPPCRPPPPPQESTPRLEGRTLKGQFDDARAHAPSPPPPPLSYTILGREPPFLWPPRPLQQPSQTGDCGLGHVKAPWRHGASGHHEHHIFSK